MHPLLKATVCGRDRWLRPSLAARLHQAGIAVTDLGAGTASLRGVDVLVYLPALLPGAQPAKDSGAAAARMTFAAAAHGRVTRAVVLSRVGPDRHDPYLHALRVVEANAVDACAKTTIIRTAHPIGEAGDAGPIADALRLGEPPTADPLVQPVAADDLLDVMQAAVEGRIGPGVVEVGGPATMRLSALRELVSAAEATRSRRSAVAWTPSRRKAAAATRRLLSLDSVASRKLASPVALPSRQVLAGAAS
jgi:hypothetical protein